MEKWIIPCNIKYYDVIGAFNKLPRLDWKQSNKSIAEGDEVYIYVGAPVSAVLFRCRVNKTMLDHIEIDDSEFVRNGEPYIDFGCHMELELIEQYDQTKYSYQKLQEAGLKGRIQGPRRAYGIFDKKEQKEKIN